MTYFQHLTSDKLCQPWIYFQALVPDLTHKSGKFGNPSGSGIEWAWPDVERFESRVAQPQTFQGTGVGMKGIWG